MACEGKKKAIATIIFFDGASNSKEVVVSKKPPVNINLVLEKENNFINYSHPMNRPMDVTFDKPVADVVLINPNQTFRADLPQLNTDLCPTLDRVAIVDKVNINNNRVYSYFDSVQGYENPYFNNDGVCDYQIYFGKRIIKILDATGEIYSKDYQKTPEYNIACDEDCPPGHVKCDSPGYPGYCCIPCAELAQRVNAMSRRLK